VEGWGDSGSPAYGKKTLDKGESVSVETRKVLVLNNRGEKIPSYRLGDKAKADAMKQKPLDTKKGRIIHGEGRASARQAHITERKTVRPR